MSILLSVIVPCYNVGPEIVALLEQITDQLDVDTELVLINDGSTDNTAQLIGNYIANRTNPQNIIFKDTANQGAAIARELGLSCATGEFVFFCDSDDIFAPDFIDTFKRYHESHPLAELLYFSSDIAVQSPTELVRTGHKVRYEEFHLFEDGEALLRFNLTREMYTAAVWTYIFKRSLASRSGAKFTFRKAHEDHLFTLKIILSALSIVAIPKVFYTQRTRQGSLTNSHKDISYLLDRITAANEAESFLAASRSSNIARYREWNFVGITTILRMNPNLLQALCKQKIGWVYFLTHANLLSASVFLRIKNKINWRMGRIF
jgi:hypothetical protein